MRSLPDLYGVGGLCWYLAALGIWHGLPWVCLRWGVPGALACLAVLGLGQGYTGGEQAEGRGWGGE